ncbi:MAG: HAMP domain-containing histidine kinase [Planctomycetaceae bacterium]|nr:HAMP domain-containing histidine kinase [Planctomycetaceae bacterium]
MAGIADRATYELPLAPPASRREEADAGDAAMPQDILGRNVIMFCRFRWLVAAVLAAAGAATAIPLVIDSLGLRGAMLWPWVLAAALVVANVGYVGWARRAGAARANAQVMLWAQIVVDLLVLTAVVHFIGSLGTFAAGAYLFHIILACIFFSRRQSLAVALVAAGMFIACVAAEQSGLATSASVFAQPAPRGLGAVNFALMIAFMIVVWYLASMLSELVRRRSRELAAANRILEQARQERMRHMLQTTHELKAPFAAIHANTQLLLKGYAGELSEAAMPIVRRIDARSRRLANEIQDMLLLANLQSLSQRAAAMVELDLAGVLAWCCQQVRDRAAERGVTLIESLQSSPARGVEEHLKMLFGNLVTNAVLYSRPGGQVRVSCHRDESGRAVACIEDRGIGIEPDKLSRIFDPYYRTAAAAQHNRESSGLGLAIVRDIVAMYGIRLKVSSAVGEGTTFEATLPLASDQPPPPADEIGAGPWRTY